MNTELLYAGAVASTLELLFWFAVAGVAIYRGQKKMKGEGEDE